MELNYSFNFTNVRNLTSVPCSVATVFAWATPSSNVVPHLPAPNVGKITKLKTAPTTSLAYFVVDRTELDFQAALLKLRCAQLQYLTPTTFLLHFRQ